MKGFRDFSIKARLYGLVAVAVLGFTSVLVVSAWLTGRYEVNGPLYNRLLTRKNVMAEYDPAALALVQPKLTVAHMLLAKGPDEVRGYTEQFRREEKRFRERQAYWRKELFEGPTKQALETGVYPPAEEFFRLADTEFLPLMAKGDREAAAKLVVGKMRPLYLQHMAAIDQAIRVGNEQTAAEESEIAREVKTGRLLLLAIGIGTV